MQYAESATEAYSTFLSKFEEMKAAASAAGVKLDLEEDLPPVQDVEYEVQEESAEENIVYNKGDAKGKRTGGGKGGRANVDAVVGDIATAAPIELQVLAEKAPWASKGSVSAEKGKGGDKGMQKGSRSMGARIQTTDDGGQHVCHLSDHVC